MVVRHDRPEIASQAAPLPAMPPRIVEFAGPSGAGKTTLYLRVTGDGGFLAPLVRRAPGLLWWSRLYLLALPVVLVRFRRLFRAMLRAPSSRGKLRGIAIAADVLAWTMTRHALAVVQSRLQRRPVVVDEGFLQTGFGLHVRLGGLFSDYWPLYFQCIPKGTTYMVFEMAPETAAARAVTRSAGTPVVFRPVLLALGGSYAEALGRLNEGFAVMLSAVEGAGIRLLSIDATQPTEDCAIELRMKLTRAQA